MLFLFKINDSIKLSHFIIFSLCAYLVFETNLYAFSQTDFDLNKKAEVHVTNMMYDIENLLQVGKVNPKEGRRLLSILLDEYFDSLLIAKYSSMPAWRKASSKEKEEFIILFEEYLINLAANRFNEFKNVKYIISKVDKRGSKMILVDGFIKAPGSKRDNTPVGWRLILNENNELKIIDIEIAKISMIVAQNDEFTSIIRQNKGKFSSLITVLEKELNSE